jgi:PPP family 3-phenylpropionic acid transporter
VRNIQPGTKIFDHIENHMKKIWPFTFYFWQYAGVAFMAPFVVLYYQNLGFSGTEIGFLAGISPLITLFSAPLWTGLADATGRYRLIMSVTLLVGSLAIFAFPLLSAFAPILLVGVVASIFLAPVSSLADSATMAMLADEKDLYGRVRLGGTIGFALAAPIAGLFVHSYGLKMAFWGCSLMYLLALLTSQKLVHNLNATPAKKKTPIGSGSRALMTNPRWLLFLAGGFAGGLALAVSNSYFFPYMKELGASETMMGLALTVGTICEVPVLFFGNRLLRRFRAYPLFIMALVITGLRLVLFSFASTPNQALLIQLFNGLTFPAMWMAGVSYADANAPVGMSATAQGIFGATVFGVGTATGGFLGGALLGSLGASRMCLVFGIIVLAIATVVILIGRFLPSAQPRSEAAL